MNSTVSARAKVRRYAAKRKTGVTASEIQNKFGLLRSTASAILAETLIPTNTRRKSLFSDVKQTVYSYYPSFQRSFI